ncbi:MAG TPA: PSD1 and planctomycete cytochrome C domain-containing protein [Vicinamibacterales bacterium]
MPLLNGHVPAFAVGGFAVVAATWVSVHAQKPATAAPAAQIDFARDIQPILESHCYECHGSKKTKNGLRLDRRGDAMKGGDTGPAIVPGDSEHSLVVRRLLGLDGEDQMPKDKDPLPDAQVALIRAWINQGAAWPESADAAPAAHEPEPAKPEHWAYRPPVRPQLPAVGNAAWVRTPIDRFVLARLDKEGLKPSSEAPFETLVRRVSLDLIGLPPSLQELNDALADAAEHGRDAAYASLVDRLLASPHYGERWARPWLDLARYADSHGFEKDLPRVMWKYRDWVIEALNHDLPFDQFTIEQIAGDMLPDATADQLIASGFNRNAMTNQEGGIDPEEAMYEVLVDRVNTTATTWLGTTLGCAQCHDHKYDPFTQHDYYRMMAFFSNNDYEVKTFGDGTRFYEPTIDVPTPRQEEQRKKIQTELVPLKEKMKAASPALDRAQAVWEQAMRLEASTSWKVLTPVSVAATGDVTLTAARDGSVLASGTNPGATVYTVQGSAGLPRITAIRVEALPDASLPKGGPGRDVYGNFQVNGIEIATKAASQPLKVEAVKADDSAGGSGSFDSFFPKVPPRDGSAPRGWRIDASRDEKRLPRQIVFTLDQPLDILPTSKLRISLNHQGSAVGQALGRFRLSVTSGATPQRVVQIPAKLRPVLDVAPAERTKKQRDDLAGFYRTVAPSLKPTRDRIAALEKALDALDIPSALVMRERVTYDRPSAFVRRRGNFTDKRERVYAGVPDVLPPLGDDQMPNRLGLARWLVQPQNPLTARVAVNRAWEAFFGRGLVETSEDFGTRGTPPSHPELLDWLATELVGQEWHMKAIHKMIVMSATYRQSSLSTPVLTERDPYNRLLARGPRFRMDAEMVRDSVLAAGGLLSPKIGGPSVFPPQPDGIWDIPYSDDKWNTSEGEDRYRRGLYVFIRRSAPYPSFLTFDATSRERCTVRRVRTNTPLQALTTLNDEAYFEAARALAARTLRESVSSEVPARASYAFRLAVTRQPEPRELDEIVASYKKQLERFRTDPQAAAQVIEGYHVEGADAGDQAAWTLVANALLNLDEVFTKQ